MDHMRRAGDVCFSQVFREGSGATGIVDYTNYDDMKYAIRKLDDPEFRNAFSCGYMPVKEYDSGRSRSRSRSRGRGYSRSRSRSLRFCAERSLAWCCSTLMGSCTLAVSSGSDMFVFEQQ